MKKLKLIFIGEGNYEEVKGDGNRLPKWDFKANGVGGYLECVLMAVHEYTAKATGQKFRVYDVRHRATREPYSVIPNKLLEQRLSSIPLYSAVKIVYKGTVPPKNYMNYDVFRDKDFKFDPQVWQNIVYENTAQDTPPVTTETRDVNVANKQQTPAASNIADDDLPF